jgi:hypothetical protein
LTAGPGYAGASAILRKHDMRHWFGIGNGLFFLALSTANTGAAMDLREEIDKLNETLKTERDDLKVRIHLAKMEAQEEWEKAEQQWQHFKTKANEFGSASSESAQDVGAALKLLGEELGHAFQRIRKSL